MKRSRFSEEQIIGILKEHQAGLECSRSCPQPWLEFWGFGQHHGLAACADFMSAAGTLFPIALCGRCSL